MEDLKDMTSMGLFEKAYRWTIESHQSNKSIYRKCSEWLLVHEVDSDNVSQRK